MMQNEFADYLRKLGKSENTIKTYCHNMDQFFRWCRDSFDEEPRQLYRANVLDYISYMTPVPSESGETESTRWWPEVDFEALREINPDLVGWIYIEGTEINYPVVQGADNQYYLKHLFTGEWNSSGCIFLGARNCTDLSDRNSILYGHHMKDGSMFHGLMEYKSQEYYDEHPTVLFLTPDANYEVKIFAGYVASVDADAWKLGKNRRIKYFPITVQTNPESYRVSKYLSIG